MLGFGQKMAHAREEPVTGQNYALGTQRENFHVCPGLYYIVQYSPE